LKLFNLTTDTNGITHDRHADTRRGTFRDHEHTVGSCGISISDRILDEEAFTIRNHKGHDSRRHHGLTLKWRKVILPLDRHDRDIR
jgi:hypothetical protein